MTARKEKMLNLKEDSIKDLEVEIKVTKDKLNKVFDEIQFFNSKNLIEKKEEMQKRMDLQKKLNESKEIFLKVSETNKNTKENMIKILEEKDNKVEQLKKSWNLKKELSADNERKMFFMHNKVEELENLINHIAKTRKTKSYAEIYELLEIEDMINFQIETSSKSEIIDDESPSFVNKIRKSLAKSSKKSLMMMNSLLKGSIMDKKKSEKKKYGFTPYGICCGSTLCSIFDSI